MVPQNFAVLAHTKLGFSSKCLQKFSGCSFACPGIFLQVLACLVLVEVVFLKVLVTRKANVCQCSCSQRKTVYLHARKDHLIPIIFIISSQGT